MRAGFPVVGVSISFLTGMHSPAEGAADGKTWASKPFTALKQFPLLLTYSRFLKTSGIQIIFIRRRTCFQFKLHVEGGPVLVNNLEADTETLSGGGASQAWPWGVRLSFQGAPKASGCLTQG